MVVDVVLLLVVLLVELVELDVELVVLLVVELVVLLVVDEVVLVVEDVLEDVVEVVVTQGSQFSFSKQTTPQRIEVTKSVSEGSFFRHNVMLPRGAIGNDIGSLPSHNHTIG